MSKTINPKERLELPKEQPNPAITNKATTKNVDVANKDIEPYIDTIEQTGMEIQGKNGTRRDVGFGFAEDDG